MENLKRVSVKTWKIKKKKGLCYVPYCKNYTFINGTTGEEFDCCMACYKRRETVQGRGE